MSAELPLSIRILLVLNPSIMNMITKGSSCSYFTTLASSSKNRMPLSILLCFRGGILWMLFTRLCCDFLRDLKDPPVDGRLVIVLISPIAICGCLNALSLSLGIALCFSLLSLLDLLDSPYFTNFYSFPFQMSSSICFFKSLQSSVQWLWSLWKQQYFFLSRTLGDECSGLGRLR